MKIFYKSILISVLALLVIMTGCKSSSMQPNATGTPYEIVVVADRISWDSEVGEMLKGELEADIPMLPQPEPSFHVMYTESGHLGTIMRYVRNILIVDINSSMYTQVALKYEKDTWAKGQVVMKMNAPDRESILEFLKQNNGSIATFFSQVEMNRMTMLLESGTNYELMDSLQKNMGVLISIPHDIKATRWGKDFFWTSNDAKKGRSDILVYTFPYVDDNTFTPEYLVAKRDSVLKVNVSGGRVDSYMTTEHLMGVEYTPITLRNKYCGVMRGLWKMVGDMMGGPFVSVTRLDERSKRVIVAEGFVYAPETQKRNYIRKLESVLYTLRVSDELEQPIVEPFKNKD